MQDLVINILKFVLTAAIAVVLAYFSYIAFSRLQAEVNYFAAQKLDGLGQLKPLVSASTYFPYDYNYNHELSRTYESLGYDMQARQFLDRTLVARATGPNAWYSLIRFMEKQAAYDSKEFSHALERSLELGKFNLYLRKRHLLLALRLEGKVTNIDSKALLGEILDRGIKEMPGFVLTEAFLKRKESAICGRSGLYERVQKWCLQIAHYRTTCEQTDRLRKAQWQQCDRYRNYWESLVP